MRSPPPKGKMLLIGSEDVEVYPQFCGDGHRCIQCFFNGKYLCAPRYWLYPTLVGYDGYPASRNVELWRVYRSEVKLSSVGLFSPDALQDRLVGQPLVPMPDGGYVEEMTNRVMNRPISARKEPYRIIDASCDKCGYRFLGFMRKGSSLNNYRDKYKCPQCGKQKIKDAKRITLAEMSLVKPLLRELRELSVSVVVARKLIQQRLGIRVSKNTYGRLVKEMGLPRFKRVISQEHREKLRQSLKRYNEKVIANSNRAKIKGSPA